MPKKNNPTSQDGDHIDWVPFPKALRLLGKRYQSTSEEIAIWVFLGKGAGGLDGYLDAPMHVTEEPTDLATLPRCSLDRLRDESEILPHLMRAYFDRVVLERFVPQERYITHKQALALLAPFTGSEDLAQALLRSRAMAGELDGLHPISVVTQYTHGHGEDPDCAPLEKGMFRKSEIKKLIASNFPDGKAADSGAEDLVERNKRLQARAQELFDEGLQQKPSKRRSKSSLCTQIFGEEKTRSQVTFERLMRLIKKPKPPQPSTAAIVPRLLGNKP